ncbi:hypothetical protein HAX54_035936 [Datura stramonium]|uniref:Uncharacterized protein n=1 Tax=Datura stramonium TaxID=4076 RepID=A0ABS8SFR6_DATST|nr:hypothetical protein [Datura stramonium]
MDHGGPRDDMKVFRSSFGEDLEFRSENTGFNPQSSPIAILYAFNHNLIPGVTDMSPHSMTLVKWIRGGHIGQCGCAFYIFLAMKNP